MAVLLAAALLPGCGGPARGERPAQSSAPAAAVVMSASDSVLVRRLDELTRARVAADSFSGVVLLAKDGVPIYTFTTGAADRETGAPNRLDTRFNLGSTDKFFTRIAIRQLQQAGKLATSDLVGKHLPDYPNARVRGEVTVEHLLSMRSGLADFDTAADYRNYLAKRMGLRTIDDFLALFADQPLKFDPGTSFEYSNAGYVVLGKIVERASGESWYDYVRRHVFAPAGMRGTGYFAVDERTPNLAVGYTTARLPGESAAPTGRRPNHPFLPYRGSSAGGGYSTAEDLLQLTRALFAHRLLTPACTDSLLGAGFRAPEPGKFGVGGWRGGSEGINSAYLTFSTGHTLIVLSNYDPPSANLFSNKLMQEWLPEWLRSSPASAAAPGISPFTETCPPVRA